jgi:ABC-type transport system substrate-binding protein
MASSEQRELIRELFRGSIARSDFIARAMALGMSVSAAAAALATYNDTTSPVHATPLELPEAASARSNTAIFQLDSGPQTSSTIMNPYSEANPMDQGLEQGAIEPLFILNYGTGKIEPWLGESMTPNATLDVWTLKLHHGITWSDGEAFNADDVVFTINRRPGRRRLVHS